MTRIKSAGNTYWENAAKQIPYPVNISERYISVPEAQLEVAQQNLMVAHFTNNGFHIQSCIEAPITRVFDPEIKLKQKARKKSEFELGDEFNIVSDGAHLSIQELDKSRIRLSYLNRNKADIITNIDQLRRVLNFQVWKRL